MEKKINILVIDDNIGEQLLLSRLIEKHFDANVHTADNGIEGIEKIKSIKPDLILLDISMPQMDGLHMLEVLKHDPIEVPPVFIWSAVRDEVTFRRIKELEIAEYLIKPVNINILLGKIKDHLDLKAV